MSWIRLGYLLLFALPLVPANLDAALPLLDQAPARGSLTGQLLIAAPALNDPNFDHTVVLLVRHGEGGAFGLVLNRPLGERPLAGLLASLGEREKSTTSGSVRVFAGGPVQPALGFVLHSTDYRRADTVEIDGNIAVTASAEVLRDIGRDQGPKKRLVVFGYAGWSPGQLEREIAAGAWFTAPGEPAL